MPNVPSARDFAARAGQEMCDPSGDARLIADLRAQIAALVAERCRPDWTPAEQLAARWLSDRLADLPYPDVDGLRDIAPGLDGDVVPAVLAAHGRLIGALRRQLATPTPQEGANP